MTESHRLGFVRRGWVTIVFISAFAAACSKKEAAPPTPNPTSTQSLSGSGAPREAAPSVKIWKTLALSDPKATKTPEEVKPLLGKKQKIAGFAIVNEFDSPDTMSEFMITPISGGCVHVPPPPPNYVVHVKMKGGQKAQMYYGPIEVEGVLSLPKVAKDREFYSYEMVGESVERFAPKRN